MIRPATAADAAVIASIYNESVAAGDCTMDEDPMPIDRQRSLIEHLVAPYGYIVLEDGDQVVGWGAAKPISDRAGYRFTAELSVFLRRSLTGRGYGRRLVEALIVACDDGGMHHLVARIEAGNVASIKLFERLGFEMVGVQRAIGFKAGRWVDVVTLQRVVDA